jgi:preprotein translocase subunit SecA
LTLHVPARDVGAAPPAPRLDPYPEREREDPTQPELIAETLVARCIDPARGLLDRALAWRAVRAAARLEPALTAQDEAAFDAHVAHMRARLRRFGPLGAHRAAALALARETARRCLGRRPYDVQLLAAALLLQGRMVEMATGEGKSLTALLTAGIAALSGWPAHVVTVNDYLAARDAEEGRGFLSRLGLTVGALVHEVPREDRPAVYACDVVYASNKEIAFDHLRDRLAMGARPDPIRERIDRLRGLSERPVMRGLPFCIVDEADSVLIDEARTPLILSSTTDPEAEHAKAEASFALADKLVQGKDFKLDMAERRLDLTPAGRERLARLAGDDPMWRNRARRESAAERALRARHLFERGDHYVLQEGKVVIVDEYTGRLQPERSWSNGLHQLIEYKEGVEVTGERTTLARTTYQRFFGSYLRLSGMSGTAREVASELSVVYGLRTVKVPTRLPVRMRRMGRRVLPTSARKVEAIVARTKAMAATGRSVLIGTRTVAAADEVSAALTAAGVAHVLLSATSPEDEAEVVARAGQPGQVTVATNMAGRGVHIGLAESVVASGGLHVILTERHDSARIDRQLEGRSARQGQPGSTEAVLSLEDGILSAAKAPLLRLAARLPGWLGRVCAGLLFARAQRKSEANNRRVRRDLLRQDRELRRMMAFAGEDR